MTRNASALTKSAVSLALASVLSFSVFAQDSSVSEKFVDIDVMIQNLKTVSGQDGTVSKQPEVSPLVSAPVVVIEKEKEPPKVSQALVPEEVKNPEPPKDMVDDVEKPSSVLLTRLSELPPESRFEFVENKFLPANKAGILFTNGKESHRIEATSDPIDVLISRSDEERPCVLSSDHSYIMFRGTKDGSGRAPTYLDVDGVQFKKGTINGATRVLAVINFKPKTVSVQGGTSIALSAACIVPEEMHSKIKEYSLGDLSEGFGGLFNFRLPQYIEI